MSSVWPHLNSTCQVHPLHNINSVENTSEDYIAGSALLFYPLVPSLTVEIPLFPGIFTARKRSCGNVMFSEVLVCPQGGLSPEGSLSGGVPVWGSLSRNTLPQYSGRAAVRILLECMLVKINLKRTSKSLETISPEKPTFSIQFSIFSSFQCLISFSR